MSAVVGVLVDAYGRIQEEVKAVVEGLSPDALSFRPDPDANSIAWLVWHLTRVQDDHVAAATGSEQVWTAAGWVSRFGLPFDAGEMGYGQSSDAVDSVRSTTPELLAGYHDAVHARTIEFVKTLTDVDLERVVDRRWDPPVTLGVRLVSVIADDLQHVGQAAYVRGLWERL